ncbi:protein RER1 isoform X1 [Hydra vulgaris]|uniref:Protein RER1 n=1 Tax=Hydra vulgaris TaxID=6087 RepID=T2MIF1_HYDVU|nr:protein RER1-like [Hydra vulgaris]
MDKFSEEEPHKPSFLSRFYTALGQRYQSILDKTVPYLIARWLFTCFLVVFYCVRVYFLQGWYIVSYALGIYLLNLFIGFLSPRIDPSRERDLFYDEDDSPGLPTQNDEEFRPFIRKLPEFKFWYSGCKSIIVGTICTCFEMFNIPVFWPILVVYFCLLFVMTMKRQIKHMIKYRYLPFTHGKRKYKGKENDTIGK